MKRTMLDKNWLVYIILASDNSLYTGITTNILRRWNEHLRESTGAKYFRGRKPQQLVYLEKDHDRSSASRREAFIKKLTRQEKIDLLCSPKNSCELWEEKLPKSP